MNEWSNGDCIIFVHYNVAMPILLLLLLVLLLSISDQFLQEKKTYKKMAWADFVKKSKN